MKCSSFLWRALGAYAALVTVALGCRAQVPFREVGLEAGVRFDQEFEPIVPFGGGAVWADFNGDGFVDLLATQTVGCNRLFLNAGDATFVPTRLEELGACDLLTRGAGVADYDNDGDADVYLTAFGTNRFLENQLVPSGTLEFVDITSSAGMLADGAGNSASAVWGDYDRDGLLDLFVTNHSFDIPPPTCELDLLWHNEGDGTFTDVAVETGIATSGNRFIAGCGLAATWSDYDRDGDLDLMVVNDFGATYSPNRLFRNDGPHPDLPWRFTDVSLESRFDYVMFGMGIAKGDLDRDGDLDYYMADIGANELAVNRGDGTFDESASEAGVEADDIEIYGGSGLVSWGVGFFDLDLDGWEDLIVSNGGAPDDAFPGMFGHSYVDLNPPYVYRNRGDGTFRERHEIAGLTGEGYHRSLAVADYDDDGDLDLHFGVLSGPNVLYRNDRAAGHWLKVRLEGTVGNRDAYGAKIRLLAANGPQQRELDGGSSFMARHEPIAHFGLAESEAVDILQIRFLSGLELELRDIAADQTLELVEPEVTLTRAELTDRSVSVEVNRHLPGAAEYDLWLERGSETGLPLRVSVAGGLAARIEIQTERGENPSRILIGRFPDRPSHWVYLN